MVDMDAADLPPLFDRANPHHECFLNYFDLTAQPGHLGVWRRDNGGYIHCEAIIKP